MMPAHCIQCFRELNLKLKPTKCGLLLECNQLFGSLYLQGDGDKMHTTCHPFITCILHMRSAY